MFDAKYNFLTCILGAYVSGYQGVPYTYVLPSVAPPAYNGVNYRPNGTGAKFQNSKVFLIPSI